MTEFLDNNFYFFTEEDYELLISEYNDIIYGNTKKDNNINYKKEEKFFINTSLLLDKR